MAFWLDFFFTNVATGGSRILEWGYSEGPVGGKLSRNRIKVL